jgi:hypothetical protein
MIRKHTLILGCTALASLWLMPAQLPAQTASSVANATAVKATAADPYGFSGYWREPRQARRGPPGGPPAGRPPGAGGPPNGPPPGAGGPQGAGGPPGGGPPGGPPGGGGGPPGGGPGSKVRAAATGKLLPWVEQRYQAYNAALAAQQLPVTNANQCLPWAVPGIGIPGGVAYGMNIVATPTEVVFLYELDHQARVVYLNQQHPAKLKPSYFGHSVGHWEGSTLVVDSVGFNDKTEIFDGISHTAQLHVVERLSINPAGRLEDAVTFEDAGAYKEAIKFTDMFERGAAFQEYVCAENNHEADLAKPLL